MTFVNNQAKDFWKQINSKFRENRLILMFQKVIKSKITSLLRRSFKKIITRNKRFFLSNTKIFWVSIMKCVYQKMKLHPLSSNSKKENQPNLTNYLMKILIFSSNILYKLLSLLFTAVFRYTIISNNFINVQITHTHNKKN